MDFHKLELGIGVLGFLHANGCQF
uniref:Uncharacterized protein n=1 Tax=Arundo donax TaxID=35708 RepID=A0A0A8ZMG1_ARUDO